MGFVTKKTVLAVAEGSDRKRTRTLRTARVPHLTPSLFHCTAICASTPKYEIRALTPSPQRPLLVHGLAQVLSNFFLYKIQHPPPPQVILHAFPLPLGHGHFQETLNIGSFFLCKLVRLHFGAREEYEILLSQHPIRLLSQRQLNTD